MTAEQRERVIAALVKQRARPLRDQTDAELIAIVATSETLLEEIDPEYAKAKNKKHSGR